MTWDAEPQDERNKKKITSREIAGAHPEYGKAKNLHW
jgi:hypothetical protein